jgi:hypothetical protein
MGSEQVHPTSLFRLALADNPQIGPLDIGAPDVAVLVVTIASGHTHVTPPEIAGKQ